MKKNKILVTGGSGFLGTYLLELLLKNKSELVVFDKLKPSIPNEYKNHLVYFEGNILSKENVNKVFVSHGPFDTVYHLASAMPNKSVSDEVTWETNVSGTYNLVSAAVRYKTNSFVFTSSNVTYGAPESLPVSEFTPLVPIEIYGKSKAQAEKELEKFKNKIHIQIFRCPVISGKGRLGLQAILFEFISENKNIYVLGNGDNIYQFVDAMDVSIALQKASTMKGFDVYTIGADEVLPLREIYQRIIDFAHSSSKIISLPKSPALMLLTILDKLNISPLGVYQYSMIGRSMYADTSKIKKKLGWKPKKTNAQSFIENYSWYIKNKENFIRVGSGNLSDNRSLPKMGIFTLLKLLS
jgi:nucleoside-diphosphate-sugar epimerase